MFRLAIQNGLISTTPQFPARLEEGAPRQGFFEHSEYLAIRAELPPDYQDVLDFGYHSGWHRKEITRLTWAEVDLAGGVVRLDPERSKTKTGRLLPLSPPLRAVLARRLLARQLDTPLVFHHHGGQPIRDWRKTWWRATRAAGLPGKLFHDLRRTVARNLARSGVSERVAMAITGHKTRSIFDRYNIVSENDLRSATQRLAEYVLASPATSTVIPFPKAADGHSR
jgi:integrase